MCLYLPGVSPWLVVLTYTDTVCCHTQIETFMLYQFIRRKCTPSNDLSWLSFRKRVVILIEIKFINHECFHMNTVHMETLIMSRRPVFCPGWSCSRTRSLYIYPSLSFSLHPSLSLPIYPSLSLPPSLTVTLPSSLSPSLSPSLTLSPLIPHCHSPLIPHSVSPLIPHSLSRSIPHSLSLP